MKKVKIHHLLFITLLFLLGLFIISNPSFNTSQEIAFCMLCLVIAIASFFTAMDDNIK